MSYAKALPEYEIKPVVLLTSEADISGFTYMAFAGTKMLLDAAIFLIEGTPNKSGRVSADTGTYDASMAKYWPGKAEDVKSFDDARKEEYSFAMAPKPLQAISYFKEIYEGWKLRLIRGDYELFPDPRLLHTPGRTPCTQSLAVQTKEGTAVIHSIKR